MERLNIKKRKSVTRISQQKMMVVWKKDGGYRARKNIKDVEE